ncbi:MAG: FtsX-like permease family protein [Candidatus Brocadiia bacterium]
MAESHEGSTPSGRRIGRQIVLPLSKAFEIAWKGIRIRLWRSLITMSGIVLAIAFLTSVWTSSAFSNALRRVEEADALYPLVQGVLEAEAVAGGEVAVRCAVVEGSNRTVEAGITPGGAIRSALDAMAIFAAELIPPDAAAIREVVDADEEVRPDALLLVGPPASAAEQSVADALRSFVETGGFLCVYGATGPAIDAPDSALGQLLPGVPGRETFTVRGSEVTEVEHLGALWSEQPPTELRVTSGKPEAEELARTDSGTVLWQRRMGKGMIVWYPLAEGSMASPDHLSWILRGRRVEEAGQAEVRSSLVARLIAHGCREQFAGQQVNMRGIWLVGLSLLVCVVGIANAMLMSVTERFREIGTMKCLGALDKFIVKLFLIESSLQGIAGSVAGAAIGLLLAFLRSLFAFHATDPETGKGYWLAVRYFPAAELLGWLLVALGTGVLLTVVAAIYPAIRAARMEPVQAMRVEA